MTSWKTGPPIQLTAELADDMARLQRILHADARAAIDKFGRDPEWCAVYDLIRTARQEHAS